MADQISSVFGADFFPELLRAQTELTKLNALVQQGTQQTITIGTGNSPQSVQELVNAIQALTAALTTVKEKTRERQEQMTTLERLQRQLAHSTTDLAQQEQNLRVQITANNAAMRDAARDSAVINGEYGKLSREFNRLSLEARNYYLTLGGGHAKTQQAIADAAALQEKLKEADAAVKIFNRNVGNYPGGMAKAAEANNKFAAGLSKTYGFIRQAANILPGLGISGIFLIGFEVIKSVYDLAKAWLDTGSNISAAKKALSSLGEGITSSQAKEAISQVNELKDSVQLAKEGFMDKDDVLKLYNDTLGKTIGKAGNLNDVEMLLNKNADAYIKFTILKASANAAYQKSAEEAVQAQFALTDPTNLKNPFADFLLKGISQGPFGAPIMGAANAAAVNAISSSTSQSNANTYQNIGNNFRQQAAALGKTMGFDFYGGKFDEKPTKEKAPRDGFNDQLRNQKDLTAALYEELIIRADGEARQQKRIAEDEKRTLDERLLAYDTYTSLQLRSLYLNEAKQKQIIQDQLDEITRIEGKSADKRTESEKNLLARKAILQQQMANVTAQTQEKQTDIVEIAEKAQTKIVEDEAERQRKIKAGQKVVLKNQPGSDNGQTQTVEQYEAELAKKREENQRKLEFYTQQSISATESLFDIERARSQARLNDLQNEIDLINKKRDADIQAIDAAFLTDAEKKRKTAEINARATAEIEQQEDRIRRERRKSAEIEKALGIAKIIINTAIAVSAQLAIPGAGIGLALAVGAAGAAQLAAAIATPIPQFRTGKGEGNDYEGLAVVGDGGPELVLREDGSAQYVDKETMTYLRKNDVVKTSKETHDIFRYMALGMPMLRTQNGKEYAIDDIMEEHANKIVGAIQRQRFPTQREQAPWFDQWQTNRNK